MWYIIFNVIRSLTQSCKRCVVFTRVFKQKRKRRCVNCPLQEPFTVCHKPNSGHKKKKNKLVGKCAAVSKFLAPPPEHTIIIMKNGGGSLLLG